MGALKLIYKLQHRGISDEDIPQRYNISLMKAVTKPIRKWFSAVFIPTIPFNGLRVWCYRMTGYKVGGALL